jgi:nucleoside-diphosphate-sugar epimerase
VLDLPAEERFSRPVPGVGLEDIASRLADAHVLVTGGTGFLGTRLVERLLIECGARPRVLVRNYARAARLARLGLDRVTLVKGELSDEQSLARAVAGCSIVFHCAMDRASQQSNVDATNALISACLRQNARLVHVSSLAVYEPLKDGDLDESLAPVRSGLRYSDAKLEVEELVMEAVRKKALDASVILPTIVYGPYGKAWTSGAANQLTTGTLVLPDHGEGICNVVYVDDVCQAMIRAAATPAALGRRYLISGPAPVSWAALYGGIAEAIGRPGPRLVATDEMTSKGGGPLRTLRSIISDPQRLARVGPIRALAEWAKPRISPTNKARLKQLYALYQRRRVAPVYLPNPQQMALYRSRCTVRIERAVSELGYRPAYDFARGMDITGKWLRWALPTEDP